MFLYYYKSKDRDAFNSNFRILDERLRVVETGLVNHLLNKKMMKNNYLPEALKLTGIDPFPYQWEGSKLWQAKKILNQR